MVTLESIVYSKYQEALRLAEVFRNEGMEDSAEKYEWLAGAIDSIFSIYETSNDLDPELFRNRLDTSQVV